MGMCEFCSCFENCKGIEEHGKGSRLSLIAQGKLAVFIQTVEKFLQSRLKSFV